MRRRGKEVSRERRKGKRGKRVMEGIKRERWEDWVTLRIAEGLLASSLNSIKLKLSAL